MAKSICPDLAESIYWMVQTMEAWFHADKESMAKYFGEGFRAKALRQYLNVEEIPNDDLRAGLSAATRETEKGDYYRNKTTHGPKLLSLIDPELVKNASPNCNRLFAALTVRLSPSAS